MQTIGVFFDGRIAADRHVTIMLADHGLSFSGPDAAPQTWRLADLKAIDPPHAGRSFRLTHASQPGARLVIHDDAFTAALVARAGHLKGGVNPHTLAKVAAWSVGGLAVVGLLAYLILQLAPQRIAFLLPDSWRDRVGQQIESQLTGTARQCGNPVGLSAIGAMASRLSDGNPDLPPLAIKVYDIPIMNAFAMPGERIVITRELIEKAQTPEEVAGVLAHEIGHVVNRHSEAQLVRATGLQILLSVLTGGGSDTVGSIAGLAAILRYTRDAEAEADEFALKSMTAAEIDPMGLKRFFELILKEEGKLSTGPLAKIGSVLATHPGTADRIGRITPLPEGVTARPVMSEDQWKALKAICS